MEEERLHRKQRLAGALRLFGRFGFSEGVAGHITARDPELTDHFWVNPFGMSFRHVRVSDLILVSHTGEVVEGNRPVNPAAFAIHSAVHAARPDVIAAAHAHSVYGKAWSSLGRLLDPITQDACVFFEDHTVCEEGGGAIVLEEAAAKALAAALGPHKATIHRNHGLFTVGQTVDEAAWWFITMERSCQAQLLAEAAGTPCSSTTKAPATPATAPRHPWPDGSPSSRCGTRSCGATPTSSIEPRRRGVGGVDHCRRRPQLPSCLLRRDSTVERRPAGAPTPDLRCVAGGTRAQSETS